MQRFRATWVDASEHIDLNALVIVLAEDLMGEGLRLELQRALTPDEQEVAAGLDTYCVSTQTGAVHYGGVDSWSLEGDELRLALTAEAADAVGVDGGFLIQVPPDSVQNLLWWLPGVFQRQFQ